MSKRRRPRFLCGATGDFPVSYDLHLGTDFDDVNNATPDSSSFTKNVTPNERIVGFANRSLTGTMQLGLTEGGSVCYPNTIGP